MGLQQPMLCSGLFVQQQQQRRHLRNESALGFDTDVRQYVVELTFWASLVDSDNWLLVARVDGIKCLSLLSFYPLAIDVQAERLLVRDAWGLDLLSQRHVCD